MAIAAYYQRGESLDYTNSTASKIPANTVIDFETRIGVAGTDILPGETGSVHMTGVFEIAKTGSGAIAMGAAVYFDGTGITDTASTNTPAGYAAKAAGASDTKILVKLLG